VNCFLINLSFIATQNPWPVATSKLLRHFASSSHFQTQLAFKMCFKDALKSIDWIATAAEQFWICGIRCYHYGEGICSISEPRYCERVLNAFVVSTVNLAEIFLKFYRKFGWFTLQATVQLVFHGLSHSTIEAIENWILSVIIHAPFALWIEFSRKSWLMVDCKSHDKIPYLFPFSDVIKQNQPESTLSTLLIANGFHYPFSTWPDETDDSCLIGWFMHGKNMPG
jgi:hypothetical protein